MRWAALLVSLGAFATGCASSEWAKVETVPGGRLYIPKMYAPLLPGSIYPDRKIPLAAKSRPVLVLVCPEKGDCRRSEILDRAAERGVVVFIGRTLPPELLRARAEVDPERIGRLEVEPRSLRAIPSSPSEKIFVATFPSDAPPAASDGTVLKLYSPDRKNLLPDEAFRDAVEWLAGELDAR